MNPTTAVSLMMLQKQHNSTILDNDESLILQSSLRQFKTEEGNGTEPFSLNSASSSNLTHRGLLTHQVNSSPLHSSILLQAAAAAFLASQQHHQQLQAATGIGGSSSYHMDNNNDNTFSNLHTSNRFNESLKFLDNTVHVDHHKDVTNNVKLDQFSSADSPKDDMSKVNPPSSQMSLSQNQQSKRYSVENLLGENVHGHNSINSNTCRVEDRDNDLNDVIYSTNNNNQVNGHKLRCETYNKPPKSQTKQKTKAKNENNGTSGEKAAKRERLQKMLMENENLLNVGMMHYRHPTRRYNALIKNSLLFNASNASNTSNDGHTIDHGSSLKRPFSSVGFDGSTADSFMDDVNEEEKQRQAKLARLNINERERKRMHDLNDALEDLRKSIPFTNSPSVRKLSKIATLMMARKYITVQTSTIHELRRLVLYLSEVSGIPVPISTGVVAAEHGKTENISPPSTVNNINNNNDVSHENFLKTMEEVRLCSSSTTSVADNNSKHSDDHCSSQEDVEIDVKGGGGGGVELHDQEQDNDECCSSPVSNVSSSNFENSLKWISSINNNVVLNTAAAVTAFQHNTFMKRVGGEQETSSS